jgi:competence protein ComEA
MKLLHNLLLAAILLFSSAAMSAQAQAEAVNINTANAEQIAVAMKGIGENKARAIVEYRTSNGKFKSIQDLENVSGIGSKTVERNKDRIAL